MKTVVIMPGGFHPFHAGHYELYKSALKAFPGAEVYVAATNDQSERPFPFALKEKLAKLAGVEPGHFVQVKSPFQSKEITQHFNPEQDVLIFVRSEKDRNESPKPGGTKKDGTPAYFQPWTGKNLQPFAKHAYFEYLPTVEFGPGITSATQIRNAWPNLDDRRKTAMVMSLYPAAQKNLKLAQNVVGMFDQVMDGRQGVAEGTRMPDANGNYKFHMFAYLRNGDIKEFNVIANGDRNAKILAKKKLIEKGYTNIYSIDIQGMSPVHGPVNYEIDRKLRLEDQGVAEGSQSKDDLIWTLNNFDYYTDNGNVYVNDNGDKIARIGSNWKHQSGKMGSGAEELSAFLSSLQDVNEGFGINYPGTYEQENNMFKGHGQRRIGNLTSENIDSELINVLQYAQQHYPNSKNKQEAFMKFVQRALRHSKSDDERQDNELERLDKEVDQLQKQVNVSESTDYLEEK
jgi:hypothetical protein